MSGILIGAILDVIRLHELTVHCDTKSGEYTNLAQRANAWWYKLNDVEQDLIRDISRALVVEHERLAKGYPYGPPVNSPRLM